MDEKSSMDFSSIFDDSTARISSRTSAPDWIGVLLLLLLALFVLLSALLVVLIAVFHFQEPPVVNFAIPFAVVVYADSKSLSV